MTPGSVLFYTYIVCAGFMVWGTDQHCSTTTNVVLVHAHLTGSLTYYAHFSYCFLIYPHESGTRHLSVLCKGPRQLLPAAYSVAQHYINSLVHPECIIFLYFTPHIARFNWMGGADGYFQFFACSNHAWKWHSQKAVDRASASFYYQGIENRTEVTCLCLGQLTKLLVLLFLPVNVVSFLPLTVTL